MSDPVVLIPGLYLTARFFAAQLPALWRRGAVMAANHARDDSIGPLARRILAEAPPRFALVGHSMGGYAAFEMLRQAPDRITRLVLVDTSARPDTVEQTTKRNEQIAQARAGHFLDIPRALFPKLVHPDRAGDEALLADVMRMAEDTGAERFVRELQAIMSRPDSRPSLAAIRCPTTVIVGDGDQVTPIEHAREMADGIAGAKLEVVAGAGHYSAMEAPERMSELLVQALSD
jgi:pimeloyl-ACP methyl ester carboxylesterase